MALKSKEKNVGISRFATNIFSCRKVAFIFLALLRSKKDTIFFIEGMNVMDWNEIIDWTVILS